VYIEDINAVTDMFDYFFPPGRVRNCFVYATDMAMHERVTRRLAAPHTMADCSGLDARLPSMSREKCMEPNNGHWVTGMFGLDQLT
jgi:hypothetical protein